ncbi:MAG: GNAT family N-acetyltransferase [Prevotellaceae bacterium]|jgi:diamine N-acetyltransferase|nr:GNAT family N-acetyltransferase [Prevotellaceae bacterium]
MEKNMQFFENYISLESEIVRLRAVEPSDIDLLYLWENDPETKIVGNSPTPYSRFDLERYILSEGDIFANKQLRLMIVRKQDNATIGAVDLFDFNPLHNRAGVGVLIYDKSNRNRGYASDALKILIDYAFAALNIHTLYCNVAPDNHSSLKCLKKAGFAECGLKREWNKTPTGRQDELILQVINKG